MGLKFNLPIRKTPDPGTETGSQPILHPMVSPAVEEVPIWNILPSYQLYESTFAKVMDPLIEDFNEEPPLYDDSPPHLVTPEAENDYFSRNANIPGSGSSARPPEPRWENTILANAHRMKNVDEFNKLVAENLTIDIVLTKKPGIKGRKPDIYDPLELEFLQGDSIHGYVIVENTGNEPLSFDMFSVVFEGRVSVNSNEASSGTKPLLFYKFLNMFDYNASWTPVFFEGQLPNTHDYIDPIDGSTLQFPYKRQLKPGVVYKKFFNFTIPENLLDCSCEPHELPQHCVLFPSIGLDKYVFLQRLRKLREVPRPNTAMVSPKGQIVTQNGHKNIKKKSPNLITRDYGFPDTSISYSVETRVIGKRTMYEKAITPNNEEFIIVKEASMPLRIIPRDIESSTVGTNCPIAEKHYKSFVKSIEKSIETGRRLQEGKESEILTRKSSTVKQSYTGSPKTSKQQINVYKVHFPYKRKILTQPSKVMGLLNAIVEKREHVLRYETPYNYKTVTAVDSKKSSMLKAQINLEYISTEGENKAIKPPEIRGVCAKIAICTIRSKKYPIPIEFSQELMFRNIVGGDDSVEKYVIAPFKKYLEELKKLIEIYGTQALGIKRQTIMDVKSLANLETKSTLLKVDNIQIISQGGLGNWRKTDDSTKVENSFELTVDIQSLFVKDSKRPTEDKLNGALTLVPSFQSCIICRYYYLLVEIKLGNGDTLPVKIPIKISK